MFRRTIYYGLKPYLPRRFRNCVRGWFTRRKRATVSDTWPILESSARTPEHWRGWPEGKNFAVVLTHDVEGLAGLAKVLPLAEAEMALGFRSSYNFIPEGEYRVTNELRGWLKGNGFEVGVHDLHHDGKLYSSKTEFKSKAVRINKYLKTWDACGFRSGFMLHNLEWAHDLDVSYDASTFDTDPFEPQPDGAGTIFPFWVDGPSNSSQAAWSNRRSNGYIELPYTLPQDSTLFLLLREKDTRIWQQKLDWIATHGGMALINVHPDYVNLTHDRSDSATFPVSHYTEFLTWIRTKYGSSFWQALPAEVADYCHSHLVPGVGAHTLGT